MYPRTSPCLGPSPVPSAEAGEDEVDVDVGKMMGPVCCHCCGGRIASFVPVMLCILVFLVVILFGVVVN